MTYGQDFLNGGTPSASNQRAAPQDAAAAVDNVEGTTWLTLNEVASAWWKYDLGAGVTRKARKLRIKPYHDGAGAAINAFTFEGSNDDSAWTSITSGNCANANQWNEFEFANAVSYRYYRISITSDHRADNFKGAFEFEMMEEDAIKALFYAQI